MNDLQRKVKNDLWQRLRDASDTETILMLLRELDGIDEATDPPINSFDVMRLRRSTFAAMRELTAKTPERAEQLIIDSLLWRCLHVVHEEDGDGWETVEENGRSIRRPSARQAARIETHELREELGKWIESYSQGEKQPLRDAVIGEVVNRVSWMQDEAEVVQSALWTLGAIGYRSSQVEDVLWRVMEREDTAGDSAIGTFAGLGVSHARRSEFKERILERIPLRPVRLLGFALQKVAEPSLLSATIQLFETSTDISYEDGKPKVSQDSMPEEELKNAQEFILFSKLTMLSHFADSLWDDETVQEVVWEKILTTCRSGEINPGHLLLGGNLAPWCNTRRLPVDFLELLKNQLDAQEPNPDEIMPGHYDVYLACLRLEESVRPWQLEGWERVSRKSLVEVRDAALSDTQQLGDNTTSPMRAKEIAWQTLARAGGKWTSEEVQRAIIEESSCYVQSEVANVVACFGCHPLPPIVPELLRQEMDLADADRDTSRFAATRGAENLARSTATREAFEALLEFGFVYNKEVLRSTSDAVDEVAVWLARDDEEGITALLLQIATNHQKPSHRRIVAVSALHALAAHNRLSASVWMQLIKIAEEPDVQMDDYFRSLAVQAVGFLPDIEEEVAPYLQRMRKARTKSQVMIKANEALARHGTWRQEMDDYLTAMGLEQRDGVWRVVAPAQIDSQAAVTLGLLYTKSAHEFERATCDVLESGGDEAVYALVRLLANEDETGTRRLSREQARLLAEDLFARSDLYRARLYLFEALALAAPEVLLEPLWESKWNHWLPDGRVALADAIGQVRWKRVEHRIRASTLLYSLLGDGLYAVRRAAGRALAAVESDFLLAICQNWQQSQVVEERKRAGEAAGWLETAAILENLSSDAEPSVREAVDRSCTASRNRAWAKAYSEKILKSGPDDVSSNFKYGEAIIRVGDDEDLREIQFHCNKVALAPNVRFWLIEIAGKLKKKWREQTQKWPEPWLQWQGIVHEANGVLRHKDKDVNVRASVWQQPAEGLRGLSAWGGALWLLEEVPFGIIDVGSAQLSLEGREVAQILIGNYSSSGTILFSGQGGFPDQNSSYNTGP